MKHILSILLISISIVGSATAQQLWQSTVQTPDSFKVGINVLGEGLSNSNAITNAFFFGFVNGRFVSDGEKEKIMDRAKGLNRFGNDGTYGVQVTLPGKCVKHHTFGVAERYHADGQLSNEALELTLYGNKRFAGEEINMDDTRLRYIRWKEIRYGFVADLSGGYSAGVSVAGIWGDQNVNISTDYARLYTSLTGEQIRLNGTLLLQQSDTAQPGPHAFNGIGFGVSGFIRKELKSAKATSGFLQLEVQDAGAIYWNNNSVQYPVDTLYVYNGTEIDRILDLQDSEIDPLTPDSIADLITPESTNGRYHTLLPATVQLSLHQDFANYDAVVGMNHRFFASYSPFFFTRIRYKTGNWRLGGNAGLGGYGTWQLGIEAAYEAEHYQIMAGTRNLEGIALWQTMGGTSAFVSLTFFW